MIRKSIFVASMLFFWIGLQAQFTCHTPHVIHKEEVANNSLNPVAICTDNNVKYVNVNVHYILRTNGTGNFNELNDGYGNSNYNGYKRADDYINDLNSRYTSIAQMNVRPCGTAQLPSAGSAKVQFVIKGVHFKRSDSWFNSTTYLGSFSTTTNNNYYQFNHQVSLGVNTESEINIYFVSSSTGGGGNGIASGLGYNFTRKAALNLSGDWQSYATNTGLSQAGLLAHEMGHLLDLKHAWYNDATSGTDGCLDTPMSTNCWNLNEPATTTCDEWCEVSNNMMDYNAYQSALTTCQIGRIKSVLENATNMNRYVNSCYSCGMPASSFFSMPSTVYTGSTTYLGGNTALLILDGRGSWAETSYSIQIDEVASAGSNTPNGTQYYSSFTGTVGRVTLESLFTFLAGKIYRVKLITSNGCGPISEYVRWVTVNSGAASGGGGIGRLEQPTDFQPIVYPNPTNSSINIEYDMKTNESALIQFCDLQGKRLKQVIKQYGEEGHFIETIDCSDLVPGIYIIRVETNTHQDLFKVIINR